MKTKLTKTLPVLILLSVMTLLLACQIGSRVASSPTQQPSNGKEAAPTQSAASDNKTFPQGDANLPDPALGLDQFTSYRQTLSIELNGTLQGSPYQEALHLERAYLGGEESHLVNSFASPSGPVHLFDARLGGYHYSQSQVNAACRAEPLTEGQNPGPNPALRLPAVFGMREDGREPVDGLTAIRYTFDENSLSNRDGALKKATGLVLLAENSGLLLRYELTVELASADFTGARTYRYSLDQIEQGQSVRLPANCPPVLADLPLLDGAQNVTNLPGFQRYSAPVERRAAVEFFNEALTSLGWLAMPGSAPDQADLDSAATVLSFAQTYEEGGRVLVIQLSEADGQLQVIAQSALTKNSVQPGTSSDAPIPSDDEPEDDPASGESATLPTDLPAYPNAQVVMQTDAVLMLTADAPIADVLAFYTREMENAGWTLIREINDTTMTLLMYSRDSASVAIAVADQDGVVQIVITSTK